MVKELKWKFKRYFSLKLYQVLFLEPDMDLVSYVD